MPRFFWSIADCQCEHGTHVKTADEDAIYGRFQFWLFFGPVAFCKLNNTLNFLVVYQGPSSKRCEGNWISVNASSWTVLSMPDFSRILSPRGWKCGTINVGRISSWGQEQTLGSVFHIINSISSTSLSVISFLYIFKLRRAFPSCSRPFSAVLSTRHCGKCQPMTFS